LQVLLAILVALAQAAGPWVRCCCVPPRLAAVCTSAPDCEAPACPHCPTAKPAASGCCQSPIKPETPPRSPQAPDCCPFNGLSVDAVPPAAPDPAAGAAPTTAVFTDASRPTDSARTALAAGAAGLPFLTAQAKLYTHHVLRC
jgi:hypothetical protein